MDRQKIQGSRNRVGFFRIQYGAPPRYSRSFFRPPPLDANRPGPSMQELKPEGVASDNSVPANLQEPTLPFRMQKNFPKEPILLFLTLKQIRCAPPVKESLPPFAMGGR